MKILTAAQIREADQYTIQNEPIASIDLMERAAFRLTEALKRYLRKDQIITVICGTGNNGGDGLVTARLLTGEGFRVRVWIARLNNNGSSDFQSNMNRLPKLLETVNIRSAEEIPELDSETVVIDALFGTGLNRPLEGLPHQIVEKINLSGAKVYAIDTPSGLLSEGGNNSSTIVRARRTFTFQVPKLAFFLPESGEYCGKWQVLDIRLHPEAIRGAESFYHCTETRDLLPLIEARQKFSHKGTYGHVLVAGGSKGKVGAAQMTAKACLRTGAGLVTALVPDCGQLPMQTALPEVMTLSGFGENHLQKVPDLEPFGAFAVGPGLDVKAPTAVFLRQFLQQAYRPVVVDADALNLLAFHPEIRAALPEGSILTPHPGEFDRMVGGWETEAEMVEKLQKTAADLKAIIVLKGAHTAVAAPEGHIYFNNTGNPGMATAGSGDLLTGMLAALLAQGYNSLDAARLGVWLHGLAGDLALSKASEESLIASDIIEHIGSAWKWMRKEKGIEK